MSTTRTMRPRPGRARRRLPLPRLAFIGAALVALSAMAWAITRTSADSEPGPAAVSADPGLSHVHGLGVNPADGSLFVATHYGTFRIPDDGDAQRVGGSFQDTMGFTVAGPDRFLGSGHPDVAGMRAGQPGRLGLIESTDAGETWQDLSLSGEVDFHGLAFARDQVFGWDSTSGRFMVSTDRKRWDTRSTLELYGFAVDPDEGRRLVAASPWGVRLSSDGGRMWAEPVGPDVVAVSWAADGTLFGIEASGAVQRSADGGASWSGSGRLPGQPQALLAADDALWAAALGEGEVTGIYHSTDGGQTWELRYRDGGT